MGSIVPVAMIILSGTLLYNTLYEYNNNYTNLTISLIHLLVIYPIPSFILLFKVHF